MEKTQSSKKVCDSHETTTAATVCDPADKDQPRRHDGGLYFAWASSAAAG